MTIILPITQRLAKCKKAVPTSPGWCLLTSWRLACVLWLGLGSLSALAQDPPFKQTSFAIGCKQGKSYLFQGTVTDAFEIDLLAGITTALTTDGILSPDATADHNQRINAFGFNPQDSLLYGLLDHTNQLVRLGSDKVPGTNKNSTQLFTIDGFGTDGKTNAQIVVGDIDAQGKMYLTSGGNSLLGTSKIVRVVNLAEATNSIILPSDTVHIGGTEEMPFISDWAINPLDDNLYSLDCNSSNGASALTLYRYIIKRDADGKVESITQEILGKVAGGESTDDPNSKDIVAGNFGAVFMDDQGTMYVSSNSTGLIHSIAHSDQLVAGTTDTPIPATYVAAGPIPDNNLNINDGARCASSPVLRQTPLPVTLVSFTATAAPNRRVQLNWTTASELNNSYFEVQHSLDGYAFTAIGQVKGQGTKSTPTSYSFVDMNPGTAATHYYRLRQVDQNGLSAFSPVRSVTLTPGASNVQLTAVPNPTTGDELSLQVQYEGSVATPAVLTVHGLLGQVVYTQSLVLAPGTSALTLPARLAPGVYLASLRGNGSFATQSTKILVTN